MECIEAAERFAAGELDAEAMSSVENSLTIGAGTSTQDYAAMATHAVVSSHDQVASESVSAFALIALGRRYQSHENDERERFQHEERVAQCRLLRDIFGNPFRPASFDPAWRTPDVIALATAAYGERTLPSGELDATRLSVLADALEEADAAPEVVAHLRGGGPHVRGCWAVDLCLGRS
jgi:hypothetical protein